MRQIVLASAAAVAAVLAASPPSAAQTADRYSGSVAYAAPQRPPVQQRPARVLAWPGKTLPAAPAPAQPYAGPQAQVPPSWTPAPTPTPTPYGYPASQPGYAPVPAAQRPAPAAVASYPSPYQAQPYYAPAPMAPAPAPGSTATAPIGVYPPGTVPPQLAHPMAVPPEYATPLVGAPQPPASIYAPPPQPQPWPGPTGAAERTNAQPQQVAAAATAHGARYYSLHRQFGLAPDPTPAPSAQGEAVELVSSIDGVAGIGPEPETEQPRTVAMRDSSGRVVQVRRTSTDETSN
jgi:hypothetical protein